MNAIDKFLNNITMYRLMVYVLGGLAALSVVFSLFGRISVTPTSLVVSLFLLITAAYAVDRLLGRLFTVPTNMESSLITGLILFLIIHPATSVSSALALLLAGGIASASKFIIAWSGKHIFNPAAFGAAAVGLMGLQATTWWIGSSVFWPFTLLLGLAIVRKVRRFPLFITFAVISIGLQLFLFASNHQPLLLNMKHALISSPLIFLATIMVTEPATMPPRRNLQMVFAALVAVLYVEAWKVGPISVYPEVALLIGNIFAYLVSPKFRVRLQLKEVQKISESVHSFIFQPDRRFNFLPGQYMEWTLVGVPYDSRGNRRTFTIASSPTESEVRLGVKYHEPSSMYKATLERLQPGDIVYASQLAGNFTLQGNEHKKLVFIAGGIGITPFRSMIKYLTDKNMSADIILLYIVGDPQEFAYMREFTAAKKIGVKIVPVVTDPSHSTPGVLTVRFDRSLLTRVVPDYAERTFYVSGPSAMVDTTKGHLYGLGISHNQIKTDHFSGY